jgi:hypothetical protein
MAEVAAQAPSTASAPPAGVSDLAVTVALVVAVTAGFVAFSPACQHWFVVPVALCGILWGVDGICWLRGRMNLYDPAGILGLLGLHGFWTAPMLMAAWNEWMPTVTSHSAVTPLDWRDWAGAMGMLNVLGLLLYRTMRRRMVEAPPARRPYSWQIARRRFFPVLAVALFISAVLQVWVYKTSGGLVGYMSAYEESPMSAFKGMGIVFMLSEAFPVLLMMGYVVLARTRPSWRGWPAILGMMALFLVLQLLFGGLRGSRSNTVWGLFWALGMVHFLVRKVPRGLIYAVLPVLVLFLYIYGFYKNLAGGGAAVMAGTMTPEEFQQKTGRGWDMVLLGNFSRADTQAMLLSRVAGRKSDYELTWGRSYLGALALLIPGRLWPDRPPTVAMEGTQALYGEGSWNPDTGGTSHEVYGLAGEAMLNFGWVAVPFAFMVYGLLVGFIRRKLLTWPAMDARLLAFPFLVNFTFVILQGDADNGIFFLIKNGLMPIGVLLLSCRRVRLPVGGGEGDA